MRSFTEAATIKDYLIVRPDDFDKFDGIDNSARSRIGRAKLARRAKARDGLSQFGRTSVRREAASGRDGASQYAPFSQQGGLGKVYLRTCLRAVTHRQAECRQVHQLFGDKLNTIIEELNETLAA